MKTATEIPNVNKFLYFSALSVNLATFGLGGAFAWSSPAIPKLNGLVDPENNPLGRPITSTEESWIASLLPLGAAASAIISGNLSDHIGRKKMILLSSVPFVVGFILSAFATSVMHFYIGRFLCGLGAGTVFTVTPMYVGEIAENSNRGILGCFMVIFITLGNLFTYGIGPYVSIKIFSLGNVVAPLLFVVIFGIWVPESPYYLVAKGKFHEAELSLLKLRCNNCNVVKREMAEITESVQDSFSNRGGWRDLFQEKGISRAFRITTGLAFFQQWSGVNVIFFYMQSIFEGTGSSLTSDVSTIIVGVVQFLAAVTASSVIDQIGRRILLMISATGNTISLVCFGAFFYLKQGGYNMDDFNWVPVGCIILFVLSYTLGFGPIAFGILGELFPQHIKSLATTISIFICLMSCFCTTTFFPHIIGAIGMGYTFWLLSILCGLGGVFTFIFVPETKGKSLSAILDMLRNR